MKSQPFPIFVISLECAADRRAAMRAQLDRLGVEYAFVPAVDGRTLEPALDRAWIDDARSSAVYGKVLTPGEKGCALSHILLWEEVARRGVNTLILEDDVVLPESGFIEWLSPILGELKGDRVVMLRHIANSFWWRGKIPLPGVLYTLRKPNHKILTTAAYFITPLAAQRLLDHLKEHKLAHPIDWWYRPDGLGFTRVVDTWATSWEVITCNDGFVSLIDTFEGDRDLLKHLGAAGRLKRRLFLVLRRALFPWMRLARSFLFAPIWPDSKTSQ